MKKSFSYQNRIRSRKKERGIAIIFTLGILGLLTVIALGFASTALLNNKLAQNVSGDSYAKSLAKNLALARVIALINYGGNDWEFDFSRIYSKETASDASGKNFLIKDHLWKLNTKSDGVKLYSFAPAGDVTWEYVRAQVRQADGTQVNGIIGRYAYVVVPDKGRLNPNINVGATFNSSDPAAAYAKYGQHLPFRMDSGGSISSTALQDILTKSYRYTAFQGAIKKAAVAEAAYKEWFHDFGIGMHAPLKTRDVFTHTTGSGSSQVNKYFTRFSMKDSVDWENVTVSDLIGESADFSATASSSTGTIDNPDDTVTYLPFLNKMWKAAGTDDKQKNRVRQLAANIIQYNRKLDETVATISDVDPANWMTNTPAYMGIGRHPMINEVGIAVEVTPGHAKDPEKVMDDVVATNVKAYTYYPKYTIKITPGVELISPYYIGERKKAEIRIEGTVKVTLQGTRALSGGSSSVSYNNATDFNDTENDKAHFQGDKTITHEMTLDDTFLMEFQADGAGGATVWQQGYTKAETFWYKTTAAPGSKDAELNRAVEKEYTSVNKDALTPYTINVATPSATAEPEADKVLFKNMKVTNIEFKIKKVLLKYNGKERDFAQLDDDTARVWNSTDYDAKLNGHLEAYADKPQFFFRSYQVIDPFVNLNKEDWGVKDYFYDKKFYADAFVNKITIPVDEKGYSKLYSHSSAEGGTLTDEAGNAEVHPNRFTDPKYQTPGDLANDGTTAGTDPTQVPFAFIRHAPMQHFWEFACIHTGARWSTLDLTTKLARENPAFTDYFPDLKTENGVEYAPSVPAGELFDQVKFSSKDTTHTEGLLNLNTDSHAVLHALFTHIKSDYRNLLTGTKSVDALPEGGTVNSNPANLMLCTDYKKPGTLNTSGCLACAILNCTGVFAFRQKSDLLIPQADLANAQSYDSSKHFSVNTPLADLQNLLKTAPNRIEKSQIIAKMMPYLRTAPVDMVYVIVLAQSIEDAGGNRTIMVDWDGTGMETAPDSTKLKKKLGLTYKDNDGNNQEISGVTLPGKIMSTNTYETYDIGADKITGEAKIVAALVRDPESGRWRIARMYYAE